MNVEYIESIEKMILVKKQLRMKLSSYQLKRMRRRGILIFFAVGEVLGWEGLDGNTLFML